MLQLLKEALLEIKTTTQDVGENVGDNEKQWMELSIGRFKNTLNYYGMG